MTNLFIEQALLLEREYKKYFTPFNISNADYL